MKSIDIKLLPISSPICQALIQEQIALQKNMELGNLIADCKEVLVIRRNNTLIAYGTFDLHHGQMMRINSLHFRDVLQNHTLAQYWLSRYVKRKLEKKCYLNFLIAS
ncbi:hypothetical protein E2R68_11405 [Psychromonas sp. RZ22]|uniref:hypothetical protein n=1 Tax=Psychromonas algarum TaxID=2555643 RepID=UPI001068724B|nr:hypothetical protein [Psychromonas sp. RZ22]TEW53752.1 hypothetical protein E2R68_11405 [Psychromonas sp. RZ22]